MTVMTILPNNEVQFEEAELIFRNFAGEEKQFNDAGDRNFCIVLDQEMSDALGAIGYNVKMTNPQDPDREPTLYIKVTVGFKGRPPTIKSITNGGRTQTMITENTAELVDGMDLDTVDVLIRPYSWEVGGKSGISAYLKKMFFVPDEDDLDRKWAPPEDVI